MHKILAVDDELSVRESYRVMLGEDYRVVVAEDGPAALATLDKEYVDLVLLDLMLPGMSGMEFLQELEQRGEQVPVIVVTGSNSVESAVKAIKHGAREFVIKPFDVEDLTALVDRIIAEVNEKQELTALRELGTAGFDNIVGSSQALFNALNMARQAMHVGSTVLITGETGTGKDVLARAIHYGSPRKNRPFVPLSCCAIPPNLLESELFGHEKGAFTGASQARVGKMKVADGGTLFLDEIGEMPLEAQAKLLRVLQDGCFYPVGGSRLVEVDVRFVCATNRDFQRAIAQGLFREDLFYRINVLPIEMPPLRKRREDIPALVAHFIAKHRPRVNSQVSDVAPRAMARLLAYDWPGNVRELENAVERILVCYRGERMLRPEHVESVVPRGGVRQETRLEEFEGLPLQEATHRLEAHLLRKALEKTGGVQSQAAQMLGTTRRILKYKMDQLGIDPGEEKQDIAS